ncbi:MAG: DUF1097 domain-containing protein [Thermoguttaceae bacterium]
MRFPGVFLFALVIGVMAAVLCIIDSHLASQVGPAGNKGFTWISFIAWAVYFLAGGNIIGGIKATIGYVLGIVASIGIILLAGVLPAYLPASMGPYIVPLAVFIVAPVLICTENIPLMNFIPAMFIASGTYFGIMTYVPNADFYSAFQVEMVYALLGFAFGWLSLIFRAPIQKAFSAACPPETPPVKM